METVISAGEDFEKVIERLSKSIILPESALGDMRFYDLQSAFQREVLCKTDIPNLFAIFGPVDFRAVKIFGENVETDPKLHEALDKLIRRFDGNIKFKTCNARASISVNNNMTGISCFDDLIGSCHLCKEIMDLIGETNYVSEYDLNRLSHFEDLGNICAICTGTHYGSGDTSYFAVTAGHLMNHRMSDNDMNIISEIVAKIELKIKNREWQIGIPGIPILGNERGPTCLLQYKDKIDIQFIAEVQPYQNFYSDIVLLHIGSSSAKSEELSVSEPKLPHIDDVSKLSYLIEKRVEVFCHVRSNEVKGVVVPGPEIRTDKGIGCRSLTFLASKDSLIRGDSGAAIKVKNLYSGKYEVVGLFNGIWTDGIQMLLAESYTGSMDLVGMMFCQATLIHPAFKQLENEFTTQYGIGSLSLVAGSEDLFVDRRYLVWNPRGPFDQSLETTKIISTTLESYKLAKKVSHTGILGEAFESRFKSARQLTDALKAHVLYNSCAVQSGKELWKWKAYNIQMLYWDENIQLSYQRQKDLTNGFKKKLANGIRCQVNKSLLVLHEALNEEPLNTIDECDQLSKKICEVMPMVMADSKETIIELVEDIIKQALQIHSIDDEHQSKLKNFCAVGLGTMALGEATPYSNLDIMLLISDENRGNKNLFENLAATCCFLINNIGEMNLEDFEELSDGKLYVDVANSGLRMHTVSMALYPEASCMLVATADEIIQRYQAAINTFDSFSNPEHDVISVLSSIVFITGDKSLFNNFEEKLQQVALTDDVSLAAMEMMRREMDEFNFNSRNSKLDLNGVVAKLPKYISLVLFGLRIYHKINKFQTPDLICMLFGEKEMSHTFLCSMEVLYFATQYVRYASHAHHKSSCMDMIIYPTTVTQSTHKLPWSIPISLLQVLLMKLTHVHHQMKQILDDPSNLPDEKDLSFTESLLMVKYHFANYNGFLELVKCLKPDETTHVTERKIRSLIECNNFQCAKEELDLLAIKYKGKQNDYARYLQLYCAYDIELAHFNDALRHANEALEILQDIHQHEKSIDLVNAHNNIGLVYEYLGDYKNALKCYDEAVCIQQAVHGKTNNAEIAALYDRMGLVHRHIADYGEASHYHNLALDIRISLYGDVPHPDIAASYSHIGSLCSRKAEFRDAFYRYKKALLIYLSVYCDEDYPEVASCYNLLGSLCINQANFRGALENYSKALSIQQKYYGNSDHLKIAESLSNIAIAYSNLGDYDKVLDNYKTSLLMCKRLYGTYNHPQVAVIFNNMGTVCLNQGSYDMAFKYFNSTLNIQKTVYELIAHPDIVVSLHNIGLVYQSFGKFEDAKTSFNKALLIGKKVYNEVEHPHTALLISSIGAVYAQEEEYSVAAERYQAALSAQMNVYKDVNHPDIALSHERIAYTYTYGNERDHKKALYNSKSSLFIRKRIYGNEYHPDIAKSYQIIGLVHTANHDFCEALKNYYEAARIQTKIYGENHLALANLYDCIGSVYREKGDYKKALDTYERALSIRKNIFGESSHLDVVSSYRKLENIYCDLNNYDMYLKYYSAASTMETSVQSVIDKSLQELSRVVSTIKSGGTFYGYEDYLASQLLDLIANNFVHQP